MLALLLAACTSREAASLVVAFQSRGEGEIEHCGCPKRPLGGLMRRNTALSRKRSEGPLVVVDAGGSLAPPPRLGPSPAELEQRRLKADLIARSFVLGGIDGMALGAADWSLGTEFVRGLADANRLPVLAANLSCGGVAPFPGTRMVEVGEYRIGLVGVTLGPVEGCEVSDPAEAIRAARPSVVGADLVLALIPADTDRTGATIWSSELPVDLVIDARGRAIRAGADRRQDSWWLSGGSRGKTLGLLNLSLVPGGDRWVMTGGLEAATKKLDAALARVEALDQRIAAASRAEPGKAANDRVSLERQREAYEKQIVLLRAEVSAAENTSGAHLFSLDEIDLGEEIPDDPEIAKLLAATKAAITATSASPLDQFVARTVTDPGSPYAGGEVCAGCHTAEHAQWSTTDHARAWQGLVKDDRANDDDCWSCHVTGANRAGGPTSPAASGGFRDVQCEACHGPGRAHAADPAGAKIEARVQVETCRTCHDGKRDEGRFDPAIYLPKVVHTAGEAE